MTLPPYQKPYLTPVQRLEHLRARGLSVRRPAIAALRIEQIGYERLRIYFISRRQVSLPNRPFIAGTTYNDIIQLYRCDEQLRDICFVAVGRFELLFRNTLSEVLSRGYGSHPYGEPSLFRDEPARREAMKSLREIARRSRDQRIVHYRASYGRPALPPIWTLKEILTFGSASHLYAALSAPVRTAIAAEFGVAKEPVFRNWLACFVDLRNICAHHDRLFNRSFQKQPRILTSAGVPRAPQNKLKALLECLDHALVNRGEPTDVTGKAGAIIGRYPGVQPGEVGY